MKKKFLILFPLFLSCAALSFFGLSFFLKTWIFKVPGVLAFSESFPEAEKSFYKDLLKEETSKKSNYRVQRYKGLGEMNASQLWETTMDPNERKLIKVNITDAALAEKRVSVLMGDAVAPRKNWIEENVIFSLEDDYRIA